MQPQTNTTIEQMPEWEKFPTPNTIPSGWDVSAFDEWKAAAMQDESLPIGDADLDQ